LFLYITFSLKIISLESDRLILRQWLDQDYKSFAILNADAEVMAYYPSVLNEEESNSLAKKFHGLIAKRGWGFWAVELRQEKQFIGFVGLHKPTYELPVSPCVEVGWRLAKKYWGQGYATEAANAALEFAFNQLKLTNIYSFTSVINKNSRAVMERLHMVNTNSNFNHPMLPQKSVLCEHVLYRIEKQRWFSFNRE